ncbi:nuclear pore complex assembly-domain-containing protein [Mycena vulgaris]|nr:nuclear pore complex assembly-domain-containing protein [Mycena vulgaris]
MDANASLSSAFSPVAALSYFDLTPGAFPWRDPRPQQIERRRAALGDLLLFDILLTSAGIRQPDTLYPPVDVESFHRLLDAIQTSQYDALKKDCLIYFLLKWYQDNREDKYRLEKCIPPHFASLADAYWHLDAGINIPRAVSILSDARLNTDWASKILQAISLSPKPMPLVLKYVRTAKPLLTEPDDIDIYTVALAESSLFEAWQFQRTFSEKNETRPRLVQKILDWCFTPAPRRNALVQLLGLALSPYEQALIQSYATSPSTLPPAGIPILQNLICVRLIQTGKYSDAVKMDRQFSSASPGNLGPQAERTKMVQDLYAALPLAERAILDSELENQGVDVSKSGGTSMTDTGNREWDTSMSWEDIRAPVPSATPAPIPPLPRVQISSLAESSSHATPQDRPRSKFGGFGSGPLTASVFPPLAFGASLSSARPIAPIIPVSNLARGNPAVQPPVPSARQPLNASAALSSLAQSTSRFTAPTTAGAVPKSLFDSAGRKQNAFYQPPPALPPPPFPGFEEGDAEDEENNKETLAFQENADMEMDQDLDLEMGRDDDHDPPDGEGLAYSVFGAKPPRTTTKRAGARTRQAAPEVKQVPPGAFVSDDDHEAEVEPPLPPPPRQTRRSAAVKTATAKPVKSATTRTRARAEEQGLGRSLPGSLMDSEDGSAEEAEDEDGDRLAPLPRRQAPPAEGMQTRRRSSRLSSSSEPESSAEKAKAPGRTRTAAGTGRKRRT